MNSAMLREAYLKWTNGLTYYKAASAPYVPVNIASLYSYNLNKAPNALKKEMSELSGTFTKGNLDGCIDNISYQTRQSCHGACTKDWVKL